MKLSNFIRYPLFIICSIISLGLITIGYIFVAIWLMTGVVWLYLEVSTLTFIFIMLFGGLSVLGVLFGLFNTLAGLLVHLVAWLSPTQMFGVFFNGILSIIGAIFIIIKLWSNTGEDVPGIVTFCRIILSLMTLGLMFVIVITPFEKLKEK